MKKAITRRINGREIELQAERRGNAVILRCGEISHCWTPHPKVGRTKDELESEFEQALATFCEELAGHHETSAHLDGLLGPEKEAEPISDSHPANYKPSSKDEEKSGESVQSATDSEPTDDDARTA